MKYIQKLMRATIMVNQNQGLMTSVLTASSPIIGSGTGLKGEYFNNSDFTAFAFSRTDATVNFNWGQGSPDVSVQPDTFSVRWTGQVQSQYSERYTFYATSDDGVRLWVNNQLIIDRWVDQSANETSGFINLVAGQKYDIKLEYYENGGDAVANLAWSSNSQLKQIIPQSQLYNTINGTTVNNVPITQNDTATTGVNQSLTLLATSLLSNDSDLDGDPLKISSVKNAVSGSVVLNAQGNPVFTPNLNFSGSASFDYVVSDGKGGSATAKVNIAVNPVNTIPAAVIGTGTGLLGQYYDNSNLTTLKLSRTDSTVNFNWAKGSPDVSIQPDTFSVRWTGQVQSQYSERYTFYTTSDDGVRLWVNNQLIIDRWVNQSAKEVSGAINLLAGQKYDIKLEYYENGGDASATLAWSSNSQLKQIIPQSQLYNTVSNTVNNVPISNNDTATASEDQPLTLLAASLLSNDSDLDGNVLTLTSVKNALNGSVVLNAQGNPVFTPNPNFNGSASFDYVVSDGKGGSATAKVNVAVIAVNDAPIANNDAGTTNEDLALTFLASQLLSNDSDVDGDILTLTSVKNALNGSVVLNAQGNPVFTPNPNFNGNASFDYIVSDSKGGSATATVKILVNPVNDAPIAQSDTATTNKDQAITLLASNLLSNDSDIDGDILKVTAVNNAINGSVALDANGNTIFTPNSGFTGNASFDYVVSDDKGGTATATVKVTVNSVLALPNLTTIYSPASHPSLSTGSDVFAPSFVQSSVQSFSSLAGNDLTPQIAEWTRTGSRGDTLVLTGWQFSNLSGTEIGKDTKFWVYGQTNGTNSVLVEATLLKLDGDIAAITLPNSLPQGSSLMVWAQNSSGYSKPVMINQTESWWIQETATRGQVASVFGRNLSQDSGTQVSQVYLEDSAGKGYWANVVAVNPYKVDFKVPDTLANGNYQVYVHNGDGGQYGWSKPLTMTIDNGLNYTGSVFNVKDFGAKGDGITDDTAAINAAINATYQKPWATIYLPKGTYLVSSTFYPNEKVRWLGDGKDLTTIKARNGSSQTLMFQTWTGKDQITFQDLTLDANRSYSNIGNVNFMRGIHYLQYINVRINAEGSSSAFDWHESSNISMKGSEVIGAANFLGTAKQVFIDKTNFYGTSYTDSILAGFGTQMISITNSTAQNLDTSNPSNYKWAKGRFFTDQPHWATSQYQYLGNNTTIDMAPPPADFNGDGIVDIDRNSGEQIMWESNEPSISFKGVISISGNEGSLNTLTAGNPTTIADGWHLTITSGKGIGQSRQVKSFNPSSNTYQLYESWNVTPDESSIIIASEHISQAVVYGNQLDGTKEAYNSPTHIASTGVQTYHGASDLIVDNNTFHELRSGVNLWTGYDKSDGKPVYFSQVTNNIIQDTLTGISFPYLIGREGTSVLGSIIRGNDFHNVDNAFEISLHPWMSATSPYPYTNMNIFEQSTLGIVDQITAFPQSSSIQNNIMLQNTIL